MPATVARPPVGFVCGSSGTVCATRARAWSVAPSGRHSGGSPCLVVASRADAEIAEARRLGDETLDALQGAAPVLRQPGPWT
jgi:hypothetical protein